MFLFFFRRGGSKLRYDGGLIDFFYAYEMAKTVIDAVDKRDHTKHRADNRNRH